MFWYGVQSLSGLGPPWMLTALALLPGAALGLVFLASKASAAAWLTSVPFAVVQLGFLAALAFTRGLTGLTKTGPLLPALLWLLVASTLATAWNRWPYDRARTGFLLVHGAPILILAGIFGPRFLAGAGMACLALGAPWMFYLKPLLRAKKATSKPPAWERVVLQGTRILFLALVAVAAAPVSRGVSPPPWVLVSGLTLVLALHVHHVKAWKGPKAQIVGLVGWGLSLVAYLRLR